MALSPDAEGLVVGGDEQEQSFLAISFDGRQTLAAPTMQHTPRLRNTRVASQVLLAAGNGSRRHAVGLGLVRG